MTPEPKEGAWDGQEPICTCGHIDDEHNFRTDECEICDCICFEDAGEDHDV